MEILKKYKEVCPNCKEEVTPAICHFTYSTWDCWGCGAKLDSRVITPDLVEVE